MVKSKFLDRLRNNVKTGFSRFQNERVQDQIFQICCLMAGIAIALILNSATPIPPILDIFYLSLGFVLFVGVLAWLSGYFTMIRVFLIGASIVSVISAFLTWVSTGKTGIIQVNSNQIDGLFRSILLATFFSLLERTTKFIEDRVEAKK